MITIQRYSHHKITLTLNCHSRKDKSLLLWEKWYDKSFILKISNTNDYKTYFPSLQRADGFYHADVNGQLGLVPGSFLDEYTNGVRSF